MFELLVLIVLAVPIGVVVSFVTAMGASGRATRLGETVWQLQSEVLTLKRRLDELTPARAPAPVAVSPVPTRAKASVPEVVPPPPVKTPAVPIPPIREPVVEAPMPSPVATEPSPREPAATHVSGRQQLERALLGNWAVWLGAAALALGGAFLVKYSIDNGLLGPATRVTLGFALGLALNASGELLHRRPPSREPIGTGTYATALIAAGMATLFASVYAAYALYGFVGSAGAFVLMAILCASAIAMSLRYGTLISVIGVAGGFVVPLLVSSTSPEPWTLFLYLAALVVSCTALVRWKSWWWLGWVTVAGAYGWALLWLATAPAGLDSIPLTFFLVFCGAELFLQRPAASPEMGAVPVIWASAFIAPVLMLLQLMATRYDAVALAGTALLAVVYLHQGTRDSIFDRLPWFAGALVTLTVLAWDVPLQVLQPGFGNTLPPLPPFSPLAVTAALLAALVSIPSFWALWRAERPQRWAVASAATPVLVLGALYLRRADALGDIPWAAIGLVIAALEVAAAQRLARNRAAPGMEEALAYHAVATVAAISLAATMSLGHTWLTVALALELPALAWIFAQTRVMVLRHVALVIAAIVGCLLLINAALAGTPGGSLVFNWILYGYGIPALAFIVSAAWFRREGDGMHVMALEAGSIVASLLLVVLEIRHAFAFGPLLQAPMSAGEVAAQTDAWLIGTIILFRIRARLARPVYLAASRVAAWGGFAILAAGPLIGADPLFDASIRVGTTPVLNLLLPLYGLPALLAGGVSLASTRAGERELAQGYAGATLLLGFFFVTLCVRQIFHGTALQVGPLGDAESYCYSAAWLLFGGTLLVAGILRAAPAVRMAGLAMLVLAVGKTFFYDMAALTGLYRAASFLGLGMALLVLGYLYQRFAWRAE